MVTIELYFSDTDFRPGVATVACISYPRVMKKAQDEVDSVVGIHRMPEFEDLGSLPYVQAIIKECLRLVVISLAYYNFDESLAEDGTRFLPWAYLILLLKMMYMTGCSFRQAALL